MYIKQTYVGTLNGVKGIWCGFKPEGAEITEIRDVLYADVGKLLSNKETGKTNSAVWLKDGDTQDNYIEIVDPDYNPEPDEEPTE